MKEQPPKILNHDMHVSVSGKIVYKAIKNYLNTGDMFKKQIKEVATTILNQEVFLGRIEKLVVAKIESSMNDYIWRKKVKDELLQRIVKGEMDDAIAQYIQKKIKG